MTTLKGTVAGPDGRPVPEASVYFLAAPVPVPDVAALTAEDGSFTLAAPAPGEYRVGSRAEGFLPGETVVHVSATNSQEIRIELSEE
jgi:hypothetical protein